MGAGFLAVCDCISGPGVFDNGHSCDMVQNQRIANFTFVGAYDSIFTEETKYVGVSKVRERIQEDKSGTLLRQGA